MLQALTLWSLKNSAGKPLACRFLVSEGTTLACRIFSVGLPLHQINRFTLQNDFVLFP